LAIISALHVFGLLNLVGVVVVLFAFGLGGQRCRCTVRPPAAG
jgi:hypothetical protein